MGFALAIEYTDFFAAGWVAAGATASSAIVLNLPQAGHLPSQRGEVAPHSAHTKTVLNFAINYYLNVRLKSKGAGICRNY
jgi:hypothetical protein